MVTAPRLLLLTPRPRLRTDEPVRPLGGRAIELLAYLALHRSDQVSGNRLRDRALGSAEADGSAKHLFNLICQARQALGRDPDGQLRLPTAGPEGWYRLSTTVGLDVEELHHLVGLGDRSSSDGLALACYRRALELIEGEPLSGVRRGYAWWSVEGHEASLGRAAVRAASRAAALALDRDDVALARWAVQQGRLVEAHAERLSHLSLRIAAHQGDADELRRVWNECRCRSAEVGDWPASAGAPGSGKTIELVFRDLATSLHEARTQASLAAMEAALRSTAPSAPAAL